MYKEQFENRHQVGCQRLTGDNSGLVYANERQVDVEVPEGGTKTLWEYDTYEVADVRDPKAVKDAVIKSVYPNGAEQKLVRQTVAKMLKNLGIYDAAEYADFKQYNELCEALSTGYIRGNGDAPAPTEAELLAKAQAKKVDEISEFDASANVNAFTVNGMPMWLTHDQRSRLSASLAVCTEPTMTKYFGGIPFTYPVDVWKQMLNAVELYADTCQTVTEAHKASVMSLATVADVEAFDITTGYPPKLSF